MEIKTVEDCFTYRLLRKIPPDKEKSKRSIELAEQCLAQGEQAVKIGISRYVILETYMAMFHASRALLYKDGVQEKSHYAIFVYLKGKYAGILPLSVISLLNIHRVQRHDAMYGLEFEPTKEDATVALRDAHLFVAEIKKCLT